MLNTEIIATIAEGAITATRENPGSARQITGIDIISHRKITLPESGETAKRSLVRIFVGAPSFYLFIESTADRGFVGFAPHVSGDGPLATQTTAAYAISSAFEELARLGK